MTNYTLDEIDGKTLDMMKLITVLCSHLKVQEIIITDDQFEQIAETTQYSELRISRGDNAFRIRCGENLADDEATQATH